MVQIDVRGAAGRSKGVPGSISGLKPRRTGPKILIFTPFLPPLFRMGPHGVGGIGRKPQNGRSHRQSDTAATERQTSHHNSLRLMLGPRGPFKGPRGPLKGSRGPSKGPRGPLKGPRGPLKGPRGYLKGPPGPSKAPRGPLKGTQGRSGNWLVGSSQSAGFWKLKLKFVFR